MLHVHPVLVADPLNRWDYFGVSTAATGLSLNDHLEIKAMSPRPSYHSIVPSLFASATSSGIIEGGAIEAGRSYLPRPVTPTLYPTDLTLEKNASLHTAVQAMAPHDSPHTLLPNLVPSAYAPITEGKALEMVRSYLPHREAHSIVPSLFSTATSGITEGKALEVARSFLPRSPKIVPLSGEAEPALSYFVDGPEPGYSCYRMDKILGLARYAPGGRLSTHASDPVYTDAAATSTLSYNPCYHDMITLWDGTRWLPIRFAATAVTMSGFTAGIPRDVFGYLSGGALALETLAWSSGIGRATAVTFQDGRLCKSGDKTRLYLGSFYPLSATTTGNYPAARLVYNFYNKVPAKILVTETTASWSYGTSTWRSLNNNNANRVEIFEGGTGYEGWIDLFASCLVSLAAATAYPSIGIARNATNTNHAQNTQRGGGAVGLQLTPGSVLRESPAVGYSYYQVVEYGETGGAASTFYGGNDIRYSGNLSGHFMC